MLFKSKRTSAVFSGMLAAALTVSSVAALLPATLKADAAGGTTYAAYGTATVDAEKDERYNETMFVELGTDKTARVEVYALWDYDHIYVYADVWDRTVSHIDPAIFPNTPWYSDSLEIFIDRTLSRSTDNNMPYGNAQIRVDTDNNLSGMVGGVIWAGRENNFEGRAARSAAKVWEDASGYSVEIAIPTSIVAPDGVTYSVGFDRSEGAKDNRGSIGYDLMLNNAIDATTREDTYTWSSGVGAPAGWNTLILMDDVPEELREQGSERVVVLGNTNVAAGALAYTDTVYAFSEYFYQAVDNNFDTYAQGLSEFWSMTVDFRFEVEIASVVVKTHKDIYPSGFKISYYNSTYNEWETLWEEEKNLGGEVMRCAVADQIGKYYITGETVTTRKIRFEPTGTIMNGNDTYSYALCEFQAFTPDRSQTVTKVSTKKLPFDTEFPAGGGAVSEEVKEGDRVTAEYTPKELLTETAKIPDRTVLYVCSGVSGGILILSAGGFLLIKRKGRKEK